MEFFLIAVGLLALVGGGEILVRGAVTLAKSLNLSPIVSLRAGVWLDPDHQISYSGTNYVAEAVLGRGEDHVHVAAGLGLAFERFQLDLAADFSELIDTVSLSLIYGF